MKRTTIIIVGLVIILYFGFKPAIDDAIEEIFDDTPINETTRVHFYIVYNDPNDNIGNIEQERRIRALVDDTDYLAKLMHPDRRYAFHGFDRVKITSVLFNESESHIGLQNEGNPLLDMTERSIMWCEIINKTNFLNEYEEFDIPVVIFANHGGGAFVDLRANVIYATQVSIDLENSSKQYEPTLMHEELHLYGCDHAPSAAEYNPVCAEHNFNGLALGNISEDSLCECETNFRNNFRGGITNNRFYTHTPYTVVIGGTSTCKLYGY